MKWLIGNFLPIRQAQKPLLSVKLTTPGNALDWRPANSEDDESTMQIQKEFYLSTSVTKHPRQPARFRTK
jgi:hypothetical protein